MKPFNVDPRSANRSPANRSPANRSPANRSPANPFHVCLAVLGLLMGGCAHERISSRGAASGATGGASQEEGQLEASAQPGEKPGAELNAGRVVESPAGSTLEPSFKAGPFLYRAATPDGQIEAFVDLDLARWSHERAFIPVYLTLVNHGPRTLMLPRDGLVLEAPDGRRIQMADAARITDSVEWGRLYEDRLYMAQQVATFYGSALVNTRRVAAFFYPELRLDPAASPARRIELGPRTFTQTFVYFPNDGVPPGLYSLRVKPENGAPISIRFPLFLEENSSRGK